MVDENILCSESHQRSQLSSTSSGETFNCQVDDHDTNNNSMQINDDIKIKNEYIHSTLYDISTSSPDSINFHNKASNDDKSNITDKKVHWNPSQVHALLDCIEKRMGEFRRKSVHKSVWLCIGKEMLEHGDFTVEHCYNKWKNLRRDIRLFTNSTNMQKLSIRNAFIMERVQKMVNEIGYDCSSRKSSSPISPTVEANSNQTNTMTTNTNNNNSNIDVTNLDEEMEESANIALQGPQINSINNSNTVIEETLVSLLSDPAVSQAILANPKLIEEILPGIDITNLIHRIISTRPDLVASLPQNSFVNHSNDIPVNINPRKLQETSNNNHHNNITSNIHQQLSNAQSIQSINNNINIPAQNPQNHNQSINHNITTASIAPNNNNGSWPIQLYELLHSFRDEESRQMQRLDQIVNYVHIMQDSTKRRLNTINQLLSLAGLLIPQK